MSYYTATEVEGEHEIENGKIIDEMRKNEKFLRTTWREVEKKVHKKRKNNDVSYQVDVIEWLQSVNVLDEVTNSFIFATPELVKWDVDFGSDEISQISPNAHILTVPNSPKGLFLIRNALTMPTQLYWAKTALEKYSSVTHTNITNLKNLGEIKEGNERMFEEGYNIWFDSLSDQDGFSKMKSLRWASLGYHYNWTLRKYEKDLKSSFPVDLAQFCKKLANVVEDDVVAEAAIVNYYPEGSQMSGHLDDAELTMNEPIVSISLGCPSIFSIGGRTKDIPPVNILLQSGDVIIMSQESRHCYHGIPIVFPHFKPFMESLVLETRNSEETAYFANIIEFLTKNRINMNVRRVLPPDTEWFDKQGTGASAKVI